MDRRRLGKTDMVASVLGFGGAEIGYQGVSGRTVARLLGGALGQARQRGLTRYIGYSGDGEAARYAVESERFDTLQTSVSIADQEAIELSLPLALEKAMGVIAKRPLANAAWRYARKPAES